VGLKAVLHPFEIFIKGNFGKFYHLEIILKGYRDVFKPYDIYLVGLKAVLHPLEIILKR